MKINEINTANHVMVNAICETITDDPHVNRTIEHGLQSLPQEQRIPVLDALEILYMHQDPLALQAWADKLADLHKGLDLGSTLKAAVTTFPWLVARVAPKTYQWQENMDDVSTDQNTQAALSANIDLASMVMTGMKTLKTFTLMELATWVANNTGVAREQLAPYIEHVLRQFPGKVSQENGRFTWQDSRGTGMDAIKRMLDDPNNP